MKCRPGTGTVFQRLREQRRQGLRLEPTPVLASGLELPSEAESKMGVYVPPTKFAEHTGISLREITRMIDQGELTHLRLGVDGPMVHVRKGLADLARQERGPAITAN